MSLVLVRLGLIKHLLSICGTMPQCLGVGFPPFFRQTPSDGTLQHSNRGQSSQDANLLLQRWQNRVGYFNRSHNSKLTHL